MEVKKFFEYLENPDQVQIALNLLNEKYLDLEYEELFTAFVNTLGLKAGDGFPVTRIFLGGLLCRARLNTKHFEIATLVSEIGAKSIDVGQGRANPVGKSVFYAANNIKTAVCEVLQVEPPGNYIVTTGCWNSEKDLCVANFIDGSDTDFRNLSFAHSMPESYLTNWPDLPRKSALLLKNYTKEKFKTTFFYGLYNITSVIASICYSLNEIDGIGYAAISDKFAGFNVAISDPSKLNCVEAERWLVHKANSEIFEIRSIEKGNIESDGSITWKLTHP